MLWDYLVTGRSAIIRYKETVTIEAADRKQAQERIGIYRAAVHDDQKLVTVHSVPIGEGYEEEEV